MTAVREAQTPAGQPDRRGEGGSAARGDAERARGFSSAPNTRPPAQLVPDPAAAKEKLRLLWLSSGSKDGLVHISQGMHAHLKEHGVPHVWNVDGHAHDATHWKNHLDHFVQRVFR